MWRTNNLLGLGNIGLLSPCYVFSCCLDLAEYMWKIVFLIYVSCCIRLWTNCLCKRCQTAGSHILPIHANMLTGVLLCLLWQENLNANHKWQKRWELDFLNLYFFPFFLIKIDNMFSCPLVLTFRAKCGKHVLRVFWWGHHSSSA